MAEGDYDPPLSQKARIALRDRQVEDLYALTNKHADVQAKQALMIEALHGTMQTIERRVNAAGGYKPATGNATKDYYDELDDSPQNLAKWVQELRRANGELAAKDRELERELRLRTDRICMLEQQVDAMRKEIGEVIAKADRATEVMSAALDAANRLIAQQENQIELLEAVDAAVPKF